MNRRRSPAERMQSVPRVFQVALIVLAVAATTGQLMQHRLAGPITHAVMHVIGKRCPSAIRGNDHQTVADGARTIDRAAFRLVADRYAPAVSKGCS